MASVFTQIVEGRIPCYRIAENEVFLAFLDINPLYEGHTIVIPKKEIDYIFDLDDDLYIGLQLFAKKVAKAIEKAIDCQRIGVAVLGLEVPHTHIHLVPLQDERTLNFANPKIQFSQEEFMETAEKIRQYY